MRIQHLLISLSLLTHYSPEAYGMLVYPSTEHMKPLDNELNIAAAFNAQAIKCLLKAGADVESKDGDGKTPMIKAGIYNNAQSVEILLNAGARLDTQCNVFGATVAHRVLMNHRNIGTNNNKINVRNNFKIIDLLCNAHANFDIKDKKGDTPLMWYIAYSPSTSHKVLQKLKQAGVNFGAVNKNNKNALHLAARYTNVEAAHFLLQQGVSAQSTSLFGITPLHYVLINNNRSHKMITLLVEAGASIHEQNESLRSPLQMALETYNSNHTEACRNALIAMLTTFAPQEVEHIVCARLWLLLRRSTHPLCKDVCNIIIGMLNRVLIEDKIAFATNCLPDVPEAELRKSIMRSYKRIFKNPVKPQKHIVVAPSKPSQEDRRDPVPGLLSQAN